MSVDGEPKFYGIYRGVCISNVDPENNYRITMRVPQVLGYEVTDWAWPCLPAGWKDALVKPHSDHPGITIANHAHNVDVTPTTTTTVGAHTHTVTASGTDPQGGTVSSTGTAATAGDHAHSVDPAPVTSTFNGGGTYYQASGLPFQHDNNHVLIQKTPKVGEGVWVMFEAGDPDYPVWMGVF